MDETTSTAVAETDASKGADAVAPGDPAATAGPMTVRQAFERAVELHKDGQHDEAGQLYRLCLARDPKSATAWTNYGALLRRTGRTGAAIAAHRRALEINPRQVNARSNLANALVDNGQAEEAVEIRRGLVADQPDNMDRLRDLCVALRACWRNHEVVRLVDEAEARLGPSEICQLQRSLAQLMLGNWAQGFRDFEARYSGDEVSLPRDAPWPRWTGEAVAGKRLVILPEQGFGDAVVMARFLPRLKAMGAHVSMVVKPPLQRLFAGLEGMDRMMEAARRADVFDFYTTNMSLPHLVGMPPGGKPPPMPRLTIPEDSRERARRMLAPFGDRLKVGIVWTGSLTYRANHRRSVSPDSFLGLAQIPGVQLVSLYKGEAHDEFLACGMAGLVLDACSDDRDFADTAAVIEQLDLMVTTDTAVVHIAGSLGKPVWNMLTWEGFWLYGAGERTSWYPSMRLIRQKRSGDWEGVFAEVEARLRGLIEARG